MSAIITQLPRRNDLVRIKASGACGRVVDIIRGPNGLRILVELAPSCARSILVAPGEVEIYGQLMTNVVADPGDIEAFIAGMFPTDPSSVA